MLLFIAIKFILNINDTTMPRIDALSLRYTHEKGYGHPTGFF